VAVSGRRPNKMRRLSHIELAEVVKTHQDFLLGRPGGLRAELVNHDLSGMLLTGSNLKDADLTGAKLTDADLSDCVLDGATMSGADLSDANLDGARMVGVDLRGSTLRSARLRNANLHKADLRDGSNARRGKTGTLTAITMKLGPTHMEKADLSGADLREANMTAVIATHTDFTDADLQGAILAHANLRGATLAGARLDGACLDHADFSGANLAYAVFGGASVATATLVGCDLTTVLTDRPSGRSYLDLSPSVAEGVRDHVRWVESDGAEGAPLVLDNVDLRGAPSLREVSLPGLSAEGAVFIGLDMTRASLVGARLKGADLRTCILKGADLRGANLEAARLNGADLRDAKLGPLLSGDHAYSTNLREALLRRTDLRGADLNGARLTSADLTDAVLFKTNLDDCDLTGAKNAPHKP